MMLSSPISGIIYATGRIALPVLRVEALAKRVDGTCSDVAEDDTKRCDDEAATAGWGILVVLNHLVGRTTCRDGLSVCFARADRARMILHGLLPFSEAQMLRRPSQRLVAANLATVSAFRSFAAPQCRLCRNL
jgi:hypothetical protein